MKLLQAWQCHAPLSCQILYSNRLGGLFCFIGWSPPVVMLLHQVMLLNDDWWCVSLLLAAPVLMLLLLCLCSSWWFAYPYLPCVVLLGVGEGSHGSCHLHSITIQSYPMAAARSTSIHSFDLFSFLFSFITSLISVLFYYFLFYLMFYPRYILESRPTIPISLWNLP